MAMRMAAAAVALVAVMGVLAPRAAAQTPNCAEKLIPCSPYMNTTGTPPDTCCGPLKDAVQNDLKCLLRPLRLAGDLQGLQHQPRPGPRPLQALRPQRHHRRLQGPFSYAVSSRFAAIRRQQQRRPSRSAGQFRGTGDELVPSSVVCNGVNKSSAMLVLPHSRWFAHTIRYNSTFVLLCIGRVRCV
uniref:Bifunctional inhibitor/plant lipid transfer protein/seed storage helical domain-containing protein n=1 Tax=Zea mays TaxID=4577 RepID=B6TKW4_MAIZE|nr:hypothetical protein [Zea mays]